MTQIYIIDKSIKVYGAQAASLIIGVTHGFGKSPETAWEKKRSTATSGEIAWGNLENCNKNHKKDNSRNRMPFHKTLESRRAVQ